MDDFAGNTLLKSETSPLNLLFTTTRHINMTVILCIQTWRFIHLNFKRLCTDIVIWKGFSKTDFINAMLQTDISEDAQELYERYKQLQQHHKLIIHGLLGIVEMN
jgi:hypothetical protein